MEGLTPISRPSLVLSAMAGGAEGTRFNLAQMESLLLLIDREIGDEIDGPHFDFEPSPYGPCDEAVLAEIKSLAVAGKVVIDTSGPYWVCLTTGGGYSEGRGALRRMPRPAAGFVEEAAGWVLAQTYNGLLAQIYQRYPDIATQNRIPLEALRATERLPEPRIHPFIRGMAQAVGVLRPSCRRPSEDPNPLERDWRAVGDDLRFAMEQVLPTLRSL